MTKQFTHQESLEVDTYEWSMQVAQSFLIREGIKSPREFMHAILTFKKTYNSLDKFMVQELRHMSYVFVYIYPVPGIFDALLSVDRKVVAGLVTYKGLRYNVIPRRVIKYIYDMISNDINYSMFIPWTFAAIHNDLSKVLKHVWKRMNLVKEEIHRSLMDYRKRNENANIDYIRDYKFIEWMLWNVGAYLSERDIDIILEIATRQNYFSLLNLAYETVVDMNEAKRLLRHEVKVSPPKAPEHYSISEEPEGPEDQEECIEPYTPPEVSMRSSGRLMRYP